MAESKETLYGAFNLKRDTINESLNGPPISPPLQNDFKAFQAVRNSDAVINYNEMISRNNKNSLNFDDSV